MTALPTLVPDRSCGTCNACCCSYALKSDRDRPAATPCPYWAAGCTIYVDRPDPCRDFYCLWRQDAALDDGWRPDRSGFLLREAFDEAGRAGMVLTLYGPADAIAADRVLDLVEDKLAQSIPLFLDAPAPGVLGLRRVALNGRLQPAIASANRDALADALRAALASLR